MTPTTADAIRPAVSAATLTLLVPSRISRSMAGNSSTPAPKMMGVDMRKLNRATESRVKPKRRPTVMVDPERETPGTSANACATPMPSASGIRMSPSPRRLAPYRSARPRAIPITDIVTAMSRGARSASFAHSLRSFPATAAGTDDTTNAQNSLRSGSWPMRRSRMLCAPARMRRIQSRQNTTSTATSVPQWSATSNASPGSSHPNSQGTRMRCALEEMGRNSASPCTTPRTIA
jgi:hypothetical protein